MATITFSGLTSGLDTSSWVDALVSVKQTTITSLQAQQEAQQKLLSVVNNIKSFFSSFQTCLQKITDSQFGIASIDLFMQNLATSSNTNILTATATTEAARQTYDVLVDQLATSTKATSGYTKSDTMYATLDTTLGKLGAKSGTITVNNQSFTISEKDTIKDLIDKFSNVGIVASFDSKKSRFTVGAAINEIDDGATGLKNVLGLQNTNINGVASGSMVYATRDTKLADLGLTAGQITIGQDSTRGPLFITKTTGKKYHLFTYGIDKDVDTLGDLLDTFNSLPNVEATIDDKGNISIRGLVLESVAGGSNLKEILNLGDVTERTVMKSNRLTWKKTHSADLTTTLHNLGITGDKTLSIDGGTATSISYTTTLQNIKDTLAASGIDMSIDENGVITIDTNGKTLSGTLLDALGLVADKSGTTLTSNAHTVTYKADGSTLLSDLGITNADTCTPYKSNTPDGAVGRAMNNLAGLTIDEFITRLKASGVDASFDKDTQQIIINDGYITGEVATKLGMTSTTETYQVAATTNTTLAKLGATDKQTLNINGTAKEYEKTATLSNIISDITDAGGTVELKDGIMKVSGVTLTGSLAALLGFSATTKGTSVTSGALSVVTNSSSTSSSAVNETQKQPLSLSDPLLFLTLSTATYTLSLNGGTAVYYDPTSTLNDIKTAVETAGGTLTINDDNTISIEGVTLSGTLVTALGLASVGTATSMTSNTAITVGGVQEFATESNTLIQLGVRDFPDGSLVSTPFTVLYINGTNYTFTITSSTLGDVFDKIKEAGGTAEVKDGVIKISGVSLRGTFVNALGLEVAQSGTTVTSGELTYTASMTSTSSASLNPVSTVPITNSTTLSNITGATDSTSYTSSIGGTSKNYTGATTLSTINADIAAAGGTMTIDSDGKITITGVNVSGAIVDVLGLTSEGKSTSISSNSPITLNQSFLVQGSTTIGSDLGVSTANRSYAIYDNYGNIIASASTDGATGSATINDWLTSVNSKMNTYYGTSGVTYAKIDNGVISVDKGYVSGNLPSAIGMTTTSTASGGKTITGTTLTYKGEASSGGSGSIGSKFLTSVQHQDVPASATRVKDVSSFTSGQTYYLSDASDLTQLSSLVNSGKSTSGVTFVMTNDIDMSSVTNFTSIGNGTYLSKYFQGTFYGNGYEIKNLKIRNESTKYTGLFGSTSNATIKDLGLSDVSIKATKDLNQETCIGSLIGIARSTTVSNCYASGGTVYSGKTSEYNVDIGGLIGYAHSGSIDYSYSTVDVSVQGNTVSAEAGGLIGGACVDISNCYATGSVNIDNPDDRSNYAGGFAGSIYAITISNCYATGDVFINNYNSTEEYVGGFIGAAGEAETISNCYATGFAGVSKEENAGIGGFLGMNVQSDISDYATFENCAYNKDTGTTKAVGSGKSTGIYYYTLDQIAASTTLPKFGDIGAGSGSGSSTYYDAQTSTTLSQLGLTTASDRTISLNVAGQSYTNTFQASDTIQDVLDYLNGLSGVSASFEDSQFRVTSNNSQNLTVGGRLATALFGGSRSESTSYEVHNANNKLYYSQSNLAMSEATRIGDLLGTDSGGTLNITMNDSTQIVLNYNADSTVGDVLLELANYGITASVSSSGVFSATSQQKITLSGDVGRALLGANGTTTYADNRYSSGQLSVMNQLGVTGGVSLDAFGISSGNIQITDKDGNLVTTFDIDNTQTLSQVASALSAYGFTLSIDSTNKKVTVTSANGNKLADGTSNLVSKLKLDTWTDTTSELTEDTTLAQMGFANGSSMSVVLDGTTTMNLSFGANNTVDDVITSLAAFGITATVTDGVFSATSNSHSFVFTGDLGSALIKGTAGYITTAIGYESKNPITYNTATDTLKTTTTISDLLGSKEGGTLRLTLDGNVINLEYNADDTVQEVIDDLANLGINATISDTGVFSASSPDKTFVLSGNIGRALQGGAPTYTQNDTKYKSGDLSYDTTSAISNSSVLKDIGITSGSIFVLDRNGNVINTIDIDENMTINQTKAALKSYGIDMSLADGKVTISSNDGYSLIDGSSNMITQFKLPAFTQITAKLTAGTTLAQMGFKEGADLNLLLDGTTPTTISFGATDTMQDIINSLQALGINCSIDATNGAFTATSTEHSFVFSGDLGKFLTSGTTGYVNSDKGYITDEPLMVDVPLVTTTSKGLTYSHALNATDTVESMGFANGGVVRLILDGSTPYALSFLATDTMQDIMDTLATYGVQTTIDTQGKVSFSNNDHTITLGGELGSYLTSGGTYTNKSTGYTSSPLSFKTTENVSEDTKLSDMGVASGALNIIKDGQVVATVQTDKDTTVKQLFSAIKPYGMEGSIIDDNILKIYSEGDTYLADGTCDAVTKLGLRKVDQGDYDGHVEYWKADTTTGLLTEDMLLTSFDKNGKTSVGSLIFTLGTGDDATQHIVNLSSTDTIKSFLDKMNAEGVHAVLDNGVIKLDNSVDGITFTGGSSGIRDTLGLNTKVIDTYSTSSRALSYQEDVTYSVANYADKDTTLSTVNVTSGKMSIFVDGVKAEVTVNETDKFSDIFSRISSAVAAKTGVTVRAGFVDTDGNIVADPTTDKNTGIIGIEVVGNHTLVVGASNDTTNFATIANLKQQSTERVAGSRALYKVNGNSLITSAGLFKDGDITEGDFTIGDATFTIDSTTTLNSLINQINKSDKSYASAYWDTLSGTLVLQSTLSGESLINIESGSSNFTKIMGFTETVAGKETLVTDRQTLGQNAIVRINGTTVTSTSNTITSDVSKIKGLTINLKGVSAGETVTIKVEQDDEGIYNAVNDIIDSYNALMEGLEKELGDGGSFEHDTMFSMMRNQLKRLMTQSVGGTTIYKNLAAIGISTGEAQDSISTDVTSLIIDKDKFMQALDKDSDAVKQLLVGTTANPGVFLKVNQIVDSTLKTTGYIASTENSINKNIKKMGNKISDLTTALNKYREQLQTKFSSMERVISNMQNSYSSFLKG